MLLHCAPPAPCCLRHTLGQMAGPRHISAAPATRHPGRRHPQRWCPGGATPNGGAVLAADLTGRFGGKNWQNCKNSYTLWYISPKKLCTEVVAGAVVGPPGRGGAGPGRSPSWVQGPGSRGRPPAGRGPQCFDAPPASSWPPCPYHPLRPSVSGPWTPGPGLEGPGSLHFMSASRSGSGLYGRNIY